MSSRQEVLNVYFARLLHKRGLVAAPEQILHATVRGGRGHVQLPDVMVDFYGLRTIIECEIASNGTAARTLSYEKAKKRVDDGIAHIGVAVVYPAKLRHVAVDLLEEEMAVSRLHYTIVTEAGSWLSQRSLFEEEEFPDFNEGNVNDISEALRRSYEQLVRDETLERAVGMMEERIEAFLNAARSQTGTTGRMAVALGIKEAPDGEAPEQLSGREARAVNRIAALILINAMIFQEVLAQKEQKVRPLGRLASSTDLVSVVKDHWRFILDEINYYPIFNTAYDLLGCLAADEDTHRAVEEMVDTALWVVKRKASLRHDLAGRIFHRILSEAKYLGAYYTAIPSAVMLLKLAIPEKRLLENWSDHGAIDALRIGDLACGTGTLLMAAADVAMDNHIRACVARRIAPQLDGFHQTLVKSTIYGFDVLPSAIHLTASTLALRAPDAPLDVTNLNCLKLGGPTSDLGSLDFFANPRLAGTLFSRPRRIGFAPF
jgi:hypothetical protein